MSFRLFYQNAGADFTTTNPNPPNISLSDGTLARLQTDQKLETTLDYFNLAILPKYYFSDRVYAIGGLVFGYASRMSFVQTETITSPVGEKFINGESTRKILAGNFGGDNSQQTKSMRLALHIGAGYDYPLSERFILNPEIAYNLSFLKVFTPSDWKVNTLFAGIGVKYLLDFSEPPKPKPIPENPIVAPPPQIVYTMPKPTPISNLTAKNVMQNGSTLNFAEINVSDEISNFVLPLLPYVFFDKDGGVLPGRYANLTSAQTANFNESFTNSAMELYHNLLNVVGKRMQIYPESKLTVTGCTEPIDDSLNSKEVSIKRAQAIKNYLTSVWGISNDRISTLSRQLPQVISNRQSIDGREENRRAELYSDDERILAPVRGNLSKSSIEPPSLALETNVQFPESVKSWALSLKSANGENLYAENKNGKASEKINWKIDENKISAIARAKEIGKYLSGELELLSDSGRATKSYAQIPIRYSVSSRLLDGRIINDTLVERYVLLFFDFDKPNISKFNENMISLIQQRIRTNSKINIQGYTDRTGPEQRNIELSGNRAKTVEEAIQTRIIPEKTLANGVGPVLIYNNDLPEGRMYNRTVIVEIYTPIEK